MTQAVILDETAIPQTLRLRFNNRFVHTLPADPRTDLRIRPVRNAAYSRVQPTPVSSPVLLAWSPEVARSLGLPEIPNETEAPLLARILGGNALLPGMEPFAARYGGHQFGNWAGQLGDGRALSLGEVVTPDGAHLELQLKGAGPTPYSRRADGRAVLRSSLREFLCSEAMAHLGVPTTRALSLVTTGDGVVRDMFYDGRPETEPGAIVCRVAPSFLRLGNFEILAAESEPALLAQLFTFTVANHFPNLSPNAADKDAVLAFFTEVASRTAQLMAHWQRVGFVHGVMNTDNLSVLGLTIDYGPYGFLDGFDPDFTPNTTDAGGRRYRYSNQPRIAHWNLARFAEALLPLVGAEAPLAAALDHFVEEMNAAYARMMGEKLGIEIRDESDATLVKDMFELLEAAETDFPLFFRALADVVLLPANVDDAALCAPLLPTYYTSEDGVALQPRAAQWLRRYHTRAQQEPGSEQERAARMNAHNPLYVPRNWLAQEAIDAATAGDVAPLRRLHEVLRHPYTVQPGQEHYAGKRPEWARHKAGCSMLSCSS